MAKNNTHTPSRGPQQLQHQQNGTNPETATIDKTEAIAHTEENPVKLDKDHTDTVRVVLGAGNAPITVELKKGDSILDVIKRAGGKLSRDDAVAVGNRRIEKPGKEPADANTTIVVTAKLANG